MSVRKSKSRSPKSPIVAGLKFNKLGVAALAAVLSLAGGIYVFRTYASSGCPSSDRVIQCISNSPNIHHTGGGPIAEKIFTYASDGRAVGFTTKTLWKATYNQTLGHYMWWGPYQNVRYTNPGVVEVPQLWYCFDYIGSNTSVTFDVIAHPPGAAAVVLSSKSVSLRPSRMINGYNELQRHCDSVAIGSFSMLNGQPVVPEVEVRIRPNSGSNNNAPIWVYKTLFAIY